MHNCLRVLLRRRSSGGRPLELELLIKFASDPVRMFGKHELRRCIWRGQQIIERTVDSHVGRLRICSQIAGVGQVLINKWGPRLAAHHAAVA
jgi:DNA-binding response OmpR family regulator